MINFKDKKTRTVQNEFRSRLALNFIYRQASAMLCVYLNGSADQSAGHCRAAAGIDTSLAVGVLMSAACICTTLTDVSA
jgi:hypothetical protein